MFTILFLLAFILTPVDAQEDFPDLEPITADNIHRLQQIGQVGRGWLRTMTFSPDGRQLVLGAESGVWFYDWQNLEAEPEYLLSYHGHTVDLAFDSTGRYLLVVNQQADSIYFEHSMYRIWDIGDGVENAQLVSERSASPFDRSGMVLTADGNYIYDYDEAVLWDTRTDEKRPFVLTDRDPISPDYRTLHHDEARGLLVVQYHGVHSQSVIAIFDDETLRQVAVIRPDILWDFHLSDSGVLIFTAYQTEWRRSALFGIQLDDLVTLGDDFTLDDAEVLWHTITSEPLRISVNPLLLTCEQPLCQIARQDRQPDTALEISWPYTIHPQTGDVIRTRNVDGEPFVVLHNVSEGVDIQVLDGFWGNYYGYTRIISPTRAFMRATRSGYMEAYFLLIDTTDWQPIQIWTAQDINFGHSYSSPIRPDGRDLFFNRTTATPEQETLLQIWDVETNAIISELEIGLHHNINISSQGLHLFVGDGDGNRLYDISQPESPQLMGILPSEIGRIFRPYFHPNGQHLVTVETDLDRHFLRIWDLNTLEAVTRIDNRHISNVQWSQDGAWMTLCESVGGGESLLTIWDFSTLVQQGSGSNPHMTIIPDGSSACRHVVFDSRGNMFLSYHHEGQSSVQIWNVTQRNRREAHRFEAESSTVREIYYAIALSPDERVLFAGTSQGALDIWRLDEDLATAHRIHVSTGGITSLHFTNDGRILVIEGGDSTLRLWGVPRE